MMIDELKQRLINAKNSGKIYTYYDDRQLIQLFKLLDKLFFIKKDFKYINNMPFFVFKSEGEDEIIETKWYIYHNDLGYVFETTDGNHMFYSIIPEYYGDFIDLTYIFK